MRRMILFGMVAGVLSAQTAPEAAVKKDESFRADLGKQTKDYWKKKAAEAQKAAALALVQQKLDEQKRAAAQPSAAKTCAIPLTNVLRNMRPAPNGRVMPNEGPRTIPPAGNTIPMREAVLPAPPCDDVK